MPLELVPLCQATVSLGETVKVSPTLLVGEITGMDVVGEGWRASMKGRTAADWLEVSPQGYGVVDVRATLETDDGAIIQVSYGGRLSFETMTAYAAPVFHTGDERYLWLNSIQAVGKGTFPSPKSLVYEISSLR